MRQAVILAAGGGRRLGAAGRGLPKCLLSVGGRPLIEHQLAALAEIGVEEVCVVAGYRAEDVDACVARHCTVIRNPCWSETNSLYSLWLAREWIRGGEVFILNSDVLAHLDVYHRLADLPGSGLAYDSSSGHEDEHMKVWVESGRLRAISKCLAPPRISGENVGLLRFERRVARLVLSEVDVLVAAGNKRAWAVEALDRLLPRLDVRCVDIADLPWVEIDSEADLELARKSVWPSVQAAGVAR